MSAHLMNMVCPRILNAECVKKFVELYPDVGLPQFDCSFENFSVLIRSDRRMDYAIDIEALLSEHLAEKFTRYRMVSDEAFDQFNRRPQMCEKIKLIKFLVASDNGSSQTYKYATVIECERKDIRNKAFEFSDNNVKNVEGRGLSLDYEKIVTTVQETGLYTRLNDKGLKMLNDGGFLA